MGSPEELKHHKKTLIVVYTPSPEQKVLTMPHKIPIDASPAYKKSLNIVNNIRLQYDSVDTRCKLNSKAAHQLRKHNDKRSLNKAIELFTENYDLQCGLRGSMSPRAIAAYTWVSKTQDIYEKVNIRNKNAVKAEREAQLLRGKEKKKKEHEKNEKRMKKNINID